MPPSITRRTATKLLLFVPAALAAPALASAEPEAGPRRARPLSASERRQLDKSIAQYRSMADKIRELKIPIGTEPAFVFRPLVSKK